MVSVPPLQLPAVPSVTALGVTALVMGTATLSVVLPEMLPDRAVITAEPALTPDASPAPLMVATDVLPDDQPAEEVRS